MPTDSATSLTFSEFQRSFGWSAAATAWPDIVPNSPAGSIDRAIRCDERSCDEDDSGLDDGSSLEWLWQVKLRSSSRLSQRRSSVCSTAVLRRSDGEEEKHHKLEYVGWFPIQIQMITLRSLSFALFSRCPRLGNLAGQFPRKRGLQLRLVRSLRSPFIGGKSQDLP